jgi:hypothetical protein
MRRVASGVGGNPTIYFSVSESGVMETEKTFCSSGCDEDLGNLPTAELRPTYGVATRTTSDKEVFLDLFTGTITGLSRY